MLILKIYIVGQHVMLCQRLSRYPKYGSRQHIIAEIYSDKICQPHTLKCCTVICSIPNWLAFSKFPSSVCFWTDLKISFSNSLPVVDKRLIGCKFWGNCGSLPGFDRVMIFVSFQNGRKWPSWRQWLNKRVKCTRCHFWRCQRHSFGMPWKP
jgi:hypothetical protein